MKSTKPMKSLKRATRLINTKYKILHTTIQVEEYVENEDFDDDDNSFKCEIYH